MGRAVGARDCELYAGGAGGDKLSSVLNTMKTVLHVLTVVKGIRYML